MAATRGLSWQCHGVWSTDRAKGDCPWGEGGLRDAERTLLKRHTKFKEK